MTFLAHQPLIKTSPTHTSDGLLFKYLHLELDKTISTIFRLEVHDLQILQIVEFPCMSPNSIMPFHNLASAFVQCLSRHQQNWPHGVNLLISATPLKVRLLHFLMEPRLLPKSIALSMYSLLTISYRADSVFPLPF